MKRNIALKISYIGKRYHGWQVQPDVPTVQGEIKKAIYKLTGEEVNVYGASRTDAGVHALGQVANFFTNSSIPPTKFKDALNSILPPDIRIVRSTEVPREFHARYSESEKRYIYIILNDEITPFLADFVMSIKGKLDIEKMKICAKKVEGKHDFAVFTPERGDTVREISLSKITSRGKLIIYDIRGRSFLRYMVRGIVGALILAGLGKIVESDFDAMISGEKKNEFIAPPHGLYLVSVKYEKYRI